MSEMTEQMLTPRIDQYVVWRGDVYRLHGFVDSFHPEYRHADRLAVIYSAGHFSEYHVPIRQIEDTYYDK
jgi:hypothetical protein